MTDIWVDRVASAAGAAVATALVVAVLAAFSYILNGDATRVSIGLVIGYVFGDFYRGLRNKP